MTAYVVDSDAADSRLHELVRAVEAGDDVVLLRDGHPVARMVPFEPRRSTRTPGSWAGRVSSSTDLVSSDREVTDLFDTSGDEQVRDVPMASNNQSADGWSAFTLFLAGSPATSVQLTYEQIEALTGRELPPSARNHRQFWSNADKNSYSRHWKSAGFRTTTRDVPAGQIRFDRVGGDAAIKERQPITRPS